MRNFFLIMVNSLLILGISFMTVDLRKIFPLSAEIHWQVKDAFRIDDKLGYTLRENVYLNSLNLRINSFGYRGKEIDLKKESVYLAGDSMVFGHGISDHETLAVQLENKLKTQVINGGVPGFGTDQSFRRLKLFLNKKPQLSRIYFFLYYNDMEPHNATEVQLYQVSHQGALELLPLKNSSKYQIRKWLDKSKDRFYYQFAKNISFIVNGVITKNEAKIKEKNYKEKLFLQLEELVSIAEDLKISLWIVELPNRYSDQFSFKWLHENKIISPYYKNLNDTKEIKSAGDSIYLENDHHLNFKGSKLIASILATY